MKKIFLITCLFLSSLSVVNAQIKFVTLRGLVKNYSSKTNACFFIHPGMIESEVAKPLGIKASNACVDKKYGKGAPINFDGLPVEGHYTNPPEEELLIEIKGYWKVSTSKSNVKTYKFIATGWEPLF